MSTPVYLLTGEPFLVEEALERVRAEAGCDALSEVSFDATADVAEITNALETPSLLGGKRLVILRDVQDLKKDAAERIAGYLEAPAPETVLILVATGRSKLDGPAKKAGTVMALEAPRGRALIRWLKERARVHELKLDDAAAWRLLDAVGTDLRELDGALEQLSTALGPGARAGSADVRRAFPRLADERIYVLTDALGERKLAEAMATLRRLIDQGEEPLVLFGAITRHVRLLLIARRVADRGARAAADVLGMPSWRAERTTRQARAFTEEELSRALSLLAEADVDIKSGEVPPEAVLDRVVFEIVTGTRVPRPASLI
ncbi:MAG TPA: DNA polymerase III subunit delta [Actinomycetota bacterium]|nr:DNA polymerase III subunit delta [Actinomycetota bacterium]